VKTLKHDDCRNLAVVDAFKGYCNCHKNMVPIDTPVCDEFVSLPKCGICANFEAGKEENMGICAAGKGRPWTYPDLIGLSCEMYKGR
jgi:hypothetical protein